MPLHLCINTLLRLLINQYWTVLCIANLFITNKRLYSKFLITNVFKTNVSITNVIKANTFRTNVLRTFVFRTNVKNLSHLGRIMFLARLDSPGAPDTSVLPGFNVIKLFLPPSLTLRQNKLERFPWRIFFLANIVLSTNAWAYKKGHYRTVPD
jgi:hypothetical protein